MTFRQQLVVRILLLVAMIAAEDDELQRELRNLSNHIGYGERP